MSETVYSQEVRARFSAPRWGGALPDGPGERRAGEAEELQRRAWVRFEVRMLDGRIADSRFTAFGCPHLIAACDLAMQQLQGQPLAAAAGLDAQALAAGLDIPVAKLGRLLVIEDALRALTAAPGRDG